ncbi:hypothetical protein U1Q18_006729 [Sarracenia purpurea var. burkii]
MEKTEFCSMQHAWREANEYKADLPAKAAQDHADSFGIMADLPSFLMAFIAKDGGDSYLVWALAPFSTNKQIKTKVDFCQWYRGD